MNPFSISFISHCTIQIKDTDKLIYLLQMFTDSMTFIIRDINNNEEDADYIKDAKFKIEDDSLRIMGLIVYGNYGDTMFLKLKNIISIQYDFDTVVILINGIS